MWRSRRRARSRRRVAAPPGILFLFLGAGAAGGLAVFIASRFALPALAAYLVGVNAVTFSLYGYDKLASILRILRVPERTLHIFDFAGGTPSGIVAQMLFRHKTAKRSYQVVFWLLAAVQAALLAWAILYFK